MKQEATAPPDPRLALPGYRDGDLNVHLKAPVKIWKTKPRSAPYFLSQYPWSDLHSIGSGPPSAVVVTGYDPFTPDSQLRAFFGGYGEIAAMDNKTEPSTGSCLGICWIRYRDCVSSRGTSSTAVDAARRAEKEATGQRVGLQTVKVERDRIGRRAKRYVESASKKNQDRRAKEQQAQEERSKPKPALRVEPVPSTSDALPTPPPNAPKGPSGRSQGPPARLVDSPHTGAPLRAAVQSRIESESVLQKIRKAPYIFVPHSSVPVMATTPPHLERRMKMFHWTEIRCDESGYFIIFEDSHRGKTESRKCYSAMNGQPMFTYTMNMECQADGNPDFVRSPSPETAAVERKRQEERERHIREEAADWEEELKQRAENLDPARGALDQLRLELKDKVLNDIKQRIAVPALNEYLEPSRHAEKRRKLGIPDPNERAAQTSSYVSQLSSVSTFKKRLGYGHITLSHKDRPRENENVFADERRRRPPKKRPEVLTLHHRLQDLYAGDESDDDEKRASREETKVSGTPVSRQESEMPMDDTVSKKRPRTEFEESVRGEESGDEDFSVPKSLLNPHLLSKEPEDMAMQELQQIVSTFPWSSKLHKSAKKELGIRRRNLDHDDRLFQIKIEESVKPSVEDIDLGNDTQDLEALKSVEEKPSKKPKAKGAKGSKKKSKKQIFEERKAAKAAAKPAEAAILEELTLPQTPKAEEDEDVIEGLEEWDRAEVEWGVSTDMPRRTVEDEAGLIMDVDGWQHLTKDDEDFKFLQASLSREASAKIANANQWVTAQKGIKTLNNGGIEGISFEPTHIKGYYVPNTTGSARTEGVGKILEAEKSKYLPHRIRVREAREKRQAEKYNPTVQAEEARKAKQAATANSRTNRANNRTAVKDLNVVKQNLNADGQQGDAIRFNQLKKRKKLVRFERSAIHGWGLYADENIAVNDMIIEYVGEKVRQAVANIREDKYDKQGVGSSYLFRIDDDTIVDATKKGGIARFINHSCSPNCTAKIIKVDGSKRIVIYALREIAKSKSIIRNKLCTNSLTIYPDEELTYDYKFERELDNNDRIPCLCGSEVCKGFLN